MTTEIPTESPLKRLAQSRKALVRQMARGGDQAQDDASPHFNNADVPQQADTRIGGVWQVLTQAAKAWWRHHPVQVGVDIGRPFLNSYARDRPLLLLGIAAGVGASVVLVKPWRLVSVTGLGLALLKSPKLSNTLLSLLQSSRSKPYLKKSQQLQKDTP